MGSSSGVAGGRLLFLYAVLDGDAALCEPRDRVDSCAATRVCFEVEVDTGGETAGAHACDLLAGGNVLADCDVDGFHVAVDGDGAVFVAQAHPLAIAGGGAGVDNFTVECSNDGGAQAVGDVDTGVEAAPAGAEGGGEYTFSGLSGLGCTGCKVSGYTLCVVLNGFVELVAQVGHGLEVCDREDLRSAVDGFGGRGGECDVLCFAHFLLGRGSVGGCGTCCAGGGHCASCYGDEGDTAFGGCGGVVLTVRTGGLPHRRGIRLHLYVALFLERS